ncbi:pentatricopeptide repeat-containing protein [Pyrus ussuriensis x Pyrus communis]|uniref:Pentatricopeptide repeat-containing protein n=1 Tax=Pyrus ussuriensis x Pyrus communis TaxID=2448454 RepID=A0A5N5GK23_9ROSA|nr:pentatricopeptide repeat-containing protein [Pyrus ussuriensis x Pyrus communis]
MSQLLYTTQAWSRCMYLAQRCTSMLNLRATHAVFVNSGVHLNTYAVSKLIAFCALFDSGNLPLYAECKVLDDARKLFDEIHQRDVIQWNVLVNGYLKCGLASKALEAFREMLVCGFEPDDFCVATGLAACANLGALWQGK